jgi:hypothetical protein
MIQALLFVVQLFKFAPPAWKLLQSLLLLLVGETKNLKVSFRLSIYCTEAQEYDFSSTVTDKVNNCLWAAGSVDHFLKEGIDTS